MKKLLLIAFVFSLALALGLALAETPDFKVENNVILIDLDGDGKNEQVELTASEEGQMGFVTLNISKQNVLTDHRIILDYDLGFDPETQIKIYPIRSGSRNLLYIETHATGSESLYSTWMVVSFHSNSLQFLAFMNDPGWSGGVGLYEGNDPVDSSTFLLYSSDYNSYSESSYLSVLDSRFAGYGLKFYIAQMPFKGWYSAAALLENQYQACAIDVTHTQLNSMRSTMTTGGSLSSAKDSGFKVSITGKIHLRTGPSIDYLSIGIINKGQTATYLGQSEFDSRGVAWHYVSMTAGTGWISSKYSKLDVIDKLIPTNLQNKVETTASIHVRTAPDVNSASLAALPKGNKLPFLGVISVDDRGIAWFKISFNGKEAWISSKYSKLL